MATMTSKRYYVAGILGTITLWYITFYIDLGSGLLNSTISGSIDKGAQQASDIWLSEDNFVIKALENDIYISKYDGIAVQKLCSEAEWREDVVMSCDKMAGGIGTLKVNVLACLRYAIEVGARLITPVIHQRTAFALMQDSFDYFNGTNLSYLFDADYLYQNLAKDCPQLQFVDMKDASMHIPPINDAMTLQVNPKTLLPDPIHGHVMKDPSQFRPALDTLINQTVEKNKLQPTVDHPLRISFNEHVGFSWPVRYDSDAFRSDWGHLARSPRHIRALSARILYRLYRKLGAHQDPNRPSKGSFLGAHIRTEDDAAVEGWTSFEVQASHVQEQLLADGLDTVYVATGTASDAERLQAFLTPAQRPEVGDLAEAKVQVLQKWDLLDDKDLELVKSLTWDQMALVDLDVMLRSSKFVGIWESSWSWTISLKRHAWSVEDPYDYIKHALTFADEYSTLYGAPGAQAIIDPCLWL